MNISDTIVAIATPPGRSGIGIVRLSGSKALDIARLLTRLRRNPTPWSPQRAELLDEDGGAVDDILVTFFASPRSYTGEDVVELSCHGAPVLLRHAVERALRNGARLAEPGEFTLRAFLNGRLDLPQAEAIRDLIEATTLHQARVAAQQAGGALARQLQPLKAQAVDLIALLEAGIDFAEDDVSVADNEELLRRLRPVASEVERLTKSFHYGRVLREGFTLAIVGRPNVGKSSLFNRLLEQDRAIVTPIAGTTRDLVSEVVALEGIPVKLIDTAGIREGEDVVERLGIERTLAAIADADLTLVVLDATREMEPEDLALIERAAGPHLLVANKIDLAEKGSPELPAGTEAAGAIGVSALTGEGIDNLRRRMIAAVAPEGAVQPGGAIVTNVRQQAALDRAHSALSQAAAAIEENVPHEMLLLDLYTALAAVDELTGKTTADDILNRIFATFCIGK